MTYLVVAGWGSRPSTAAIAEIPVLGSTIARAIWLCMYANMLNVIFATKNGAATINRVLEGYSRCASPSGGWRLIVADNGSTDETAEILKRWSANLPLTVIQHLRPGKNGSLNRALAEADGDLLIFSDDDAVPSEHFLTEWATRAATLPDYDVFGAVIDPVFPGPLPDFLEQSRQHFGVLYAEISRAEGEAEPSDIYGPNMAVRRRVFDAGIRFNEGIGPNAKNQNYGMGSESELCDRLHAAGYKFWFNAGSVVRHLVRPNQIEWPFFSGRAYRHGSGVGTRHNLLAGSRGPLDLVRRFRWKLRRLAFERKPEPPISDPQATWEHHWTLGYLTARQRSV